MNRPILEQPILFISDAHLGGFSEKENKRIETELIQLIDYCERENIRIAILGDLFDYWMEYPDHTPKVGEKLLDRFDAFNRKMGPALYITGNHDNWTREHFCERGFYLEHEQYICSLNGTKMMLLHGDGLSNSEHKLPRPRMHRLLRNEYFLRVYQALFSSKTGIGVMKHFSRFTRSFNSDDEDGKKLTNWARQKLRSTDIDLILCGHDHVPRCKYFPFGTYINLGTFYRHRSMVFYNNGTPSLVFWAHKMESLQKFEQ
ncbi:MAG TPA: UDP-2,3-diacylglucosamine diphosphatase [Balneolaceae bacterium]